MHHLKVLVGDHQRRFWCNSARFSWLEAPVLTNTFQTKTRSECVKTTYRRGCFVGLARQMLTEAEGGVVVRWSVWV